MMRILTRYLAQEVIPPPSVLLALVMLFGFFDFIHELGDLGKGNYRPGNAVAYAAQLARQCLRPVPGCGAYRHPVRLVAPGQSFELTMLRVSGYRCLPLPRALMVVGLGFVVLNLLFGEFISPAGEAFGARDENLSHGNH